MCKLLGSAPAGKKNYRARLIQNQIQNCKDNPTRTQPPLNSRKMSSEFSYTEISAGKTKERTNLSPPPIPVIEIPKLTPRFPVKIWITPSLKHSQRLPVEIRNKTRLRNYFRRIWQQTRDPHFHSEYLKIKGEVTEDTKEFYSKRYADSIQALTPDNNLWRKTAQLRKPFTIIPPLRGAGGSGEIALIDKAEVLANSLQNQFQLNRDIENRPLIHSIQQEVEEFLLKPHINDLEPIRAQEVADFINKLKSNKAPGLDLITNRMLKNLPLKFILYITLILNLMLERCYFPQCWKTAVVVPIPKPDQNLELPQNHRPISLLSSLS
ncbi:putative RNA-directed DNA polymerase from transposon X-element [Araneus ventricosus]|uniref:Putative RNA-directed DNA polymerase from transposon X-element n=1 Tax=Araneus ventricosus TaxID=182803 RepID=A0A4Y2UK01_ARAVE|nr:putative RNA-directed DNA polymerase from transposon X-element [Araneus ventricosus]